MKESRTQDQRQQRATESGTSSNFFECKSSTSRASSSIARLMMMGDARAEQNRANRARRLVSQSKREKAIDSSSLPLISRPLSSSFPLLASLSAAFTAFDCRCSTQQLLQLPPLLLFARVFACLSLSLTLASILPQNTSLCAH